MKFVPKRLSTLLVAAPVIRRAAFHVRRMTGGVDRSFFFRIGAALVGFLVLCSVAATLAERNTKDNGWSGASGFFHGLERWFYWSLTTVMGSGDSSRPETALGYVVSWLLVLFGVAIVASITGALVGFLIDYLLKEGQGMGASGYRDHIVVCGWNATARELVQELSTDEYHHRVVVIADTDKNPAGEGVYFVNGDITLAADLERAGITEAMAAVICPADGSNEADLRSILCVMAIEALAPRVRTVVEANNPAHIEHFQRAHADEIVVSSRLVSRLMARSSLYPGLAGIVTSIVSGGAGSELYRVTLPEEYVGLPVDALSARLRDDHRATLLSISRGGRSFVNPPEDFRLQVGDDAVVVAESLGGCCRCRSHRPTSRVRSHQATTGTSVPGSPVPVTVAEGSRTSGSPWPSKRSSAWVPPVAMAVTTACTQAGSPHASYTERVPSTECSVVPTRCSSPPSSGAGR